MLGSKFNPFKIPGSWDFPGGPGVKNPPPNAGDAGLILGRGTKIPHATGQLSPCATTTELVRSGALTPQLERGPHAATKSLHATTEDPACHEEDLCAATETRYSKIK